MRYITGGSRRERRLHAASLLAFAVGCLYLVAVALVDPLQWLQNTFTDSLFQEATASQNVVVVAIGEEELSKYGRISTWPRGRHAAAIDQLADAGARVIAYDMLFADEGPDDSELAAAMARAANVVLAASGEMKVSADADAATVYSDIALPAEPMFASAAVVASTSVETDGDGRIRRVPLEIADTRGNVYPALSLAAFYLQFGQLPPEEFAATDGSLPLFGRSVPIESHRTMRINYTGGLNSFPHLAFDDVLAGDFNPSLVDGKIVLVGVVATGIDRHSTPLLGNAAGIEIHANALDTLLRDRFLRRTSAWIGLATSLALAAIAVVAVLRWRVGGAVLFVLTAGFSYIILSVFMFYYQGRLLDAVNPPATLALTVLAGLTYRVMSERAAQQEVTDLFGRYVSADVAGELMRRADRGELRLGGEVREVTVLFGDIRGFTTLSLGMEPAALVQLINDQFNVIVECITREGGIVNKFVGDAVMAFWNTPNEVPDHAYRACVAALSALDELAARPHDDGSIRFGFGVNTGLALAGNVGSSGRFEYTVMGETVNTSSRLSGAAGGGEVYVGQLTRDLLGDRISVDDLPPQQLKGMATPIAAYRLRREPAGPPATAVPAEAFV